MSRRKQSRGDRRQQSHSGGRTTEPGGAREELLASLDLLAKRRAPYADLLQEIVARTFERFPPPAAGPIVEIGAGTGQLRAWLPPALTARALHTDPSAAALAALRRRAPGASAAVAVAERLPLAAGACAGVVGLSVFDAVADPDATVAEIARVLPPGGRFVHFLDMATLLEAPFAKLAASALVPIPNVFSDPGDHEWPLDIVLLPRDWLKALLDLAARLGHGFAAAFAETFRPFLAEPFDAQAATRAFQAVASNGERRHALSALLTSAGQAALPHGLPVPRLLPFHSGRYLKSVLDTAFASGGRFSIDESAIVARSAPRATGGPRYRSLCLGHERISAALPARPLTESARHHPPGVPLTEAAMFVFVAQRL